MMQWAGAQRPGGAAGWLDPGRRGMAMLAIVSLPKPAPASGLTCRRNLNGNPDDGLSVREPFDTN
jgi:hypothetical protein